MVALTTVVAALLGPAVTPAETPTASAAAAHAALPFPRSELAFAHRLSGGGMNLWRMPLSELDEDFARPDLVRRLSGGGWSYDRSRVMTGNFGNITAGDDGTADFVIWHAADDGSVNLWAVGGGSDTAPRLWRKLRSPWSWAKSRPMVGDLNGDGWDDLLVHHLASPEHNYWALLSDGQRLRAPVEWTVDESAPWTYSRQLLADFDGGGSENDMLTVQLTSFGSVGPTLSYSSRIAMDGTSYWGDWLFDGYGTQGWSFAGSRQLAGDLTADGYDDVVTVHSSTRHTGLNVWLHENCDRHASTSGGCLRPPVLWQALSSGAWSWSDSRQVLAFVDGDGAAELVSLHRNGTGGINVWVHRSDGTRFRAPELIASLAGATGWRFDRSRALVAHL